MEGSGSAAEKAVPALEPPAPGTSTGGLASGRAAACETLVARPGAAAAVALPRRGWARAAALLLGGELLDGPRVRALDFEQRVGVGRRLRGYGGVDEA